jgi:hypothetical protein
VKARSQVLCTRLLGKWDFPPSVIRASFRERCFTNGPIRQHLTLELIQTERNEVLLAIGIGTELLGSLGNAILKRRQYFDGLIFRKVLT